MVSQHWSNQWLVWTITLWTCKWPLKHYALCKQNSLVYADLLMYNWELEAILHFNYCDLPPQKLETTNP
jgi:hypothetical protein